MTAPPDTNPRAGAPGRSSRTRSMRLLLLAAVALGVAVLRQWAIERHAQEFYRRYGRS